MATHELRFRTLGSLLAILAIPLLCGAKGGCGGDVSIGDDATLCVDSACGGMPTIACADGSSPYTGRCIEDSSGKCGWESRGCPAPGECEKSKCGPAIGAASYRCSDGSTGGATGKCLQHSDGTCGWEIRDCPPPPKPVSCEVSSWTGVDKGCAIESDCVFGYHQLSCCGSMAAIGYNAKSSVAFDTAEKACRGTYPGCGCPAAPTTTEDGLTASTLGEIGVTCKIGKCTTYVRMTGK